MELVASKGKKGKRCRVDETKVTETDGQMKKRVGLLTCSSNDRRCCCWWKGCETDTTAGEGEGDGGGRGGETK